MYYCITVFTEICIYCIFIFLYISFLKNKTFQQKRQMMRVKFQRHGKEKLKTELNCTEQIMIKSNY